MTCQEVLECLDDYVDGQLPEDDARELREHVESCCTCREEEAAARVLASHVAGLPKSVPPARELWPGIAVRLDALEAPRRAWKFRVNGLALLTAAATLAVIAAGAYSFLEGGAARRDGPAPGIVLSSTPAACLGSDAGLEQAQAEQLAALRDCEKALAPQTIRIVRENLDILDAASRTLCSAIEEDPANPHLMLRWMALQQRKIGMLAAVVRLSGAG